MKCQSCQAENAGASSFCKKCGTKLIAEPEADYNTSVTRTKTFFFVLLAYVGLAHFISFDSYIIALLSDLFLAIIVIVFFMMNYKSQIALFVPETLNVKLLIVMPLCLLGLAFGVSHFSDFINDHFLHADTSYYNLYIDAPFPLAICILSIAVFPAIFEEIAFRGILYDELMNVMSARATVIITAILFTILHFSAISFLWILPLGLLFGYLRMKYNTIVYGMAGHFVYNLSIVLIEYFAV